MKISKQQELLKESCFCDLRKVRVCLAGLSKPRVRTRAGTGGRNAGNPKKQHKAISINQYFPYI